MRHDDARKAQRRKKRNRAARRISYDGHLVLKGSEVYPKHRGKPDVYKRQITYHLCGHAFALPDKQAISAP